MTTISKLLLFSVFLALPLSAARAQEIIHAVSGTVTSANAVIQLTDIDTDDGSSAHFRWIKTPPPKIDFDKKVSADATPVDKFSAKGNHVIAYYFGEGDVRTLVALHDLGTAPVNVTAGTVVKLNRKERVLTIDKRSGGQETFNLTDDTVADTSTGVKKDLKFDLDKSLPVLITSRTVGGNETALLIAPSF